MYVSNLETYIGMEEIILSLFYFRILSKFFYFIRKVFYLDISVGRKFFYFIRKLFYLKIMLFY